MERFLLALPAVFFIVDPFGVVPLFIAMTAGDPPAKARAMALRACLTAGGLLVAFALFGALLFKLFGVTLPAFRVAGGLLLLVTSLDMLRARNSETKTSGVEQEEGVRKEDIAIVPLAIPLLAGPGAIATVMVLMANRPGVETGLAVCASIAVTMIVTYFMLAGARYLSRALGQTGLAILHRVFGLILAAIAVQFMVDGLKELWAA
jgi:multiple antibiotic resistance protein